MATKKFWLKERFNPQFDKPYYIRCGQLTKVEAKKKENSLYGYNNMISFNNQEEYENRIKTLIEQGFSVQY